jgi:hypothetical protein
MPSNHDCRVKKFSDLPSEENKTSWLLNNGFLCRQGSLLVNAPTGAGKSVMAVQFMVSAALGLPFLELRPRTPLRTFMMYDEDTEYELRLMFEACYRQMKLTPEQRQTVLSSTRILQKGEDAPTNFSQWAIENVRAAKFVPDVVITNPVFSFVTGDMNKQETAARFVRGHLTRIQRTLDVATISFHHKNKPSDLDSVRDASAYGGSGSADIANAVRAIIDVIPKKVHGRLVARFVVPKRHREFGTGLDDNNSFHGQEVERIPDSPPGYFWLPMDKGEAKTQDEANEQRWNKFKTDFMDSTDAMTWRKRLLESGIAGSVNSAGVLFKRRTDSGWFEQVTPGQYTIKEVKTI